MQEKIRINKFLSQSGVCSRREADKLIELGKVIINGILADKGTKVDENDEVIVNGKTVTAIETKVVIAYNKPIGTTCTHKDEHAKRTIFEDINYPIQLNYAGRLDKDSHGLLLLTNDGDLIQNLMRSKNNHEKEYRVRVNRKITDDFINKMSNGIYINELKVMTKKCSVWQIDDNIFGIILTQGLNRQIRRMCMECDYMVADLQRVRIKNIKLGEIELGHYEEIKGTQLEKLYENL